MSYGYDPYMGELVSDSDLWGVREVIEVRRQLAEDELRRAVIAELERLGYTVTPPRSLTD